MNNFLDQRFSNFILQNIFLQKILAEPLELKVVGENKFSLPLSGIESQSTSPWTVTSLNGKICIYKSNTEDRCFKMAQKDKNKGI
jgi:hypothetical protein